VNIEAAMTAIHVGKASAAHWTSVESLFWWLPDAPKRSGIPAALICPGLLDVKARIFEQTADALGCELIAVLRGGARSKLQETHWL